MPKKDKIDRAVERWRKLLLSAENAPKNRSSRTVRIEVAKVLRVGREPGDEVAVVKDTKGRVWIIPEAMGEKLGKLRGLVSRYNVRPGMKLLLEISEHVVSDTEAFTLTPEVEDSEEGIPGPHI